MVLLIDQQDPVTRLVETIPIRLEQYQNIAVNVKEIRCSEARKYIHSGSTSLCMKSKLNHLGIFYQWQGLSSVQQTQNREQQFFQGLKIEMIPLS